MRVALTRALVSVFWLATALYALLSAIPFASQQFLQPQLVPRGHRVRRLARLALARGARRRGGRPGALASHPASRAVCAFVGSWAAVDWLELMSHQGSRRSSRRRSRLSCRSRRWCHRSGWRCSICASRATAADAACSRRRRRWPTSPPALAAALIVSATHAVLTLPAGASRPRGWCRPQRAMLHLVVFCGDLRAAVSRFEALRASARRPDAAEAWLARVVRRRDRIGLFMHRIVLSSLSFTGATRSVSLRRSGRHSHSCSGRAARGRQAASSSALSGLVPAWAPARRRWPGSGSCSR